MKKQKIYVDTSVIGGCFDPEFHIWSNGLYTDFKGGLFIPLVSEVTAAEILEAPGEVRHKYNELFNYGAELLPVNQEVIELAEMYIKRNILTEKFLDDALHIAIATIMGADILVSWNFKHIVHFDKIRLFNAVNRETGYGNIEIYSPREVTSYEE